MVQKYRSKAAEERREAIDSAHLLAIMSLEFMGKEGIHYRQFDCLFTQCAEWYQEQKNLL